MRTSSGWEPADRIDLDGPGITHGICPECLERETQGLPVPALLEAAAAPDR